MNMKIVLVRISLSVDCSTVTFSLLMSVLLRSIGYENIKLIIGRSLVNSYKVIIGVSSCLDVSTVEATLVSGFGRQRSLKVESMELEPRRSLNSVCKELLGVTSGEIVTWGMSLLEVRARSLAHTRKIRVDLALRQVVLGESDLKVAKVEERSYNVELSPSAPAVEALGGSEGALTSESFDGLDPFAGSGRWEWEKAGWDNAKGKWFSIWLSDWLSGNAGFMGIGINGWQERSPLQCQCLEQWQEEMARTRDMPMPIAGVF